MNTMPCLVRWLIIHESTLFRNPRIPAKYYPLKQDLPTPDNLPWSFLIDKYILKKMLVPHNKFLISLYIHSPNISNQTILSDYMFDVKHENKQWKLLFNSMPIDEFEKITHT